MAGVAALAVHTELLTPGVDVRRLAWMWGWAAVSWTWWARRLPPVISLTVVCRLSTFRLPRLPSSPSSPLPFPPSLASSSLRVSCCASMAGVAALAVHTELSTPCINVRCLAWTWWARHLPPVVSLSVVCRSSAFHLPSSPSLASLSLRVSCCASMAGVAALAVHTELSTPCVDVRCLAWTWGCCLVDVVGTSSAPRHLVVCRLPLVGVSSPSSPIVSLTFSSLPCLFVFCVFMLRVNAWCLAWTWGWVLWMRGAWTWWAHRLPSVVSSSAVRRHFVSPSSSLLPRFASSPYLSVPPHLFVSLYTRAARRYCRGGRACGAYPAVDALR
ncbi:hypothetical protein PAXINDRAFT_17501 [Paxillus involutus ATCC 200175]|uniref:Uncharacterized protein n=1 Tax=Paxillus involutus ATCC 200175 TaxID=664439 RepID=A0A0C9SQ37_PAXIN|nr:hypothetical protein PAXINDRAFT_17501 [Paxillus involutus ATCC 200175]